MESNAPSSTEKVHFGAQILEEITLIDETDVGTQPIHDAPSSCSKHTDVKVRSIARTLSTMSMLSSTHSAYTYSSLTVPLSGSSLLPSSGRTTPNGSQENHAAIEMKTTKLRLMVNWLHQQQTQKMWSSGGLDEGVILRGNEHNYICSPKNLSYQCGGLFDAARKLNVRCAMTINTSTIKLMLEQCSTNHIPLPRGLRLQVLPDIAALPHSQKHHFAAFIQDPGLLVVWDDDPGNILARVEELESQMMNMIWKDNAEPVSYIQAAGIDCCSSEKANIAGNSKLCGTSARRISLIQPVIVAVTIILMLAALGAGWRSVAIETKVDRVWLRLIFPVIGPIQAWLGLFFMQSLATCAAQIFGPVSQTKTNSKFYSGIAPARLQGPILPHVTVQCPVYKEGLWAVIDPTIKSVKAAISTYEMQGGSANIFVNDDGMQLISKEEAHERQQYYDEHVVGWVARPQHNARVGGSRQHFLRAGKFKKASNMNYALNVSVRVEETLQKIKRSSQWSNEQEQAAYHLALSQVVTEDGGFTWAAGDIRIGDYILLIDSDTRVPKDCFIDAVSEMEQSPNVAIIQFASGVMNVTESWFEKGITFFTHLVYTSIKFAVANGDVAPFVGHNAFLRWSAVQEVATSHGENPSYESFWTESTVSEDFDMALRLQTSGYIIRLATYANNAFKEGVSLTVYDELARWEKYAYGCSELIFNPLVHWIFKGPLTPLCRRFMFSGMPLHSKITIMAYIGTYFAIASAWMLSLANYILIGWFDGYLDHYYIDSFKIYFSILVVFNVIGNLALAVLRYRIDEKPLLPALAENFKWAILLTIFLGGVSLHLSQAILCHLFSIDMTWGATSKEATSSSVFKEIPTIMRKFRFTFALCLLLTVGMVVLSGVGPLADIIPYDWQITSFVAIFPLGILVASHALLPLVLNPGLMQFTF